MLTTVLLDGVLGRKFGHRWEFKINSVGEALRMVDANRPGFLPWMKSNLGRYDRYRVICTYEDGRSEHLTEEDVQLERRPKTIRFVPIITGAGATGKIIAGVVLIIIGALGSTFGAAYGGATWGPMLIKLGAALIVGGIVEALSPRPKNESSERKDKTSYLFDGPVNTEQQGVPVPLIYGTCLVGSHAISANLSIDQLM